MPESKSKSVNSNEQSGHHNGSPSNNGQNAESSQGIRKSVASRQPSQKTSDSVQDKAELSAFKGSQKQARNFSGTSANVVIPKKSIKQNKIEPEEPGFKGNQGSISDVASPTDNQSDFPRRRRGGGACVRRHAA